MILYHFAPDFLLENIMKEGLTKGMLLINFDTKELKQGYQWLTNNNTFDQSWNKYSNLPYDRAANRLEVEVEESKDLMKWTDFGAKLVTQKTFEILSEFGDPENWYLFKGNISPVRIKQVVSKTFQFNLT